MNNKDDLGSNNLAEILHLKIFHVLIDTIRQKGKFSFEKFYFFFDIFFSKLIASRRHNTQAQSSHIQLIGLFRARTYTED